MFDIGFAELILVAVVGLLVIGPERLPGTIRTASAWLNKFRRGFNDIKREVQQELHNDAVLQDLKQTGEQLKHEANTIGQSVSNNASALIEQEGAARPSTAATPAPPADQDQQ